VAPNRALESPDFIVIAPPFGAKPEGGSVAVSVVVAFEAVAAMMFCGDQGDGAPDERGKFRRGQ
jgi:hypothetical protein